MIKESLSAKKTRLKKVVSVLRKVYPEPKCALVHKDPLQLMVATILSAQCTDKRVNMVTPDLFRRYHTARDYASETLEVLCERVKSTGFFRNKAANIIAAAGVIEKEFGGEVPSDMESLVKLPGVGRKTANVILGTAFGKSEGVVVDTHVKRLSARLGFFVGSGSDPEKIERELMKIVPKSDWIVFSHLLILHGRNRCDARKPDCPACEVSALCPFPRKG